MLAAAEPVDAAALERAVAAVLEHHDALRLRFTRGDGGEWTQAFAAPGGDAPFEVVDFTALSGDALSAAIEAHAAATQRAAGPGARPPHPRRRSTARGAGEPDRAPLDRSTTSRWTRVSWGSLLEDLETAYRQVLGRWTRSISRRGRRPFARWAERLAEWASVAPRRAAEAAWWLARPWERRAPAPRGRPRRGRPGGRRARGGRGARRGDHARAAAGGAARLRHAGERRAAGRARPRAGRAGPAGDAVAVELEGHGREELFDGVDLVAHRGLVHQRLPRAAGRVHATDAATLLRGTKETLRAVPGRGIGFGALRWMAGDAELRARLAALPVPEVNFNYLGQSAPAPRMAAGVAARRRARAPGAHQLAARAGGPAPCR